MNNSHVTPNSLGSCIHREPCSHIYDIHAIKSYSTVYKFQEVDSSIVRANPEKHREYVE